MLAVLELVSFVVSGSLNSMHHVGWKRKTLAHYTILPSLNPQLLLWVNMLRSSRNTYILVMFSIKGQIYVCIYNYKCVYIYIHTYVYVYIYIIVFLDTQLLGDFSCVLLDLQPVMPGMALNILKITVPACDAAATCQFDATWRGKDRVWIGQL